MRQLPPFAWNSGLLPARGKDKQYALRDRTVRFTAVLIWIIAALLIACSSESTSPPPQVRNETSTDARPSVAATATELPTAMPAAELTPDQSVPPATMGPHQSSDDDRSTGCPASNGNGANRHTTGADGDCATTGDPDSDRAAGTADSDIDRCRNSSARDRVSSPSHAAGL